eukprot:6707861-Prymnesium_polylepis.1
MPRERQLAGRSPRYINQQAPRCLANRRGNFPELNYYANESNCPPCTPIAGVVPESCSCGAVYLEHMGRAVERFDGISWENSLFTNEHHDMGAAAVFAGK